MSIFDSTRFLNLASASDHDFGAVMKAINILREHVKREHEASEAEYQEAKKALAFLEAKEAEKSS